MDDSSRVTVDLQRLVLTRTPLTRYTNVPADLIFDCNEHDNINNRIGYRRGTAQRSKSVEILTTSAQLREKNRTEIALRPIYLFIYYKNRTQSTNKRKKKNKNINIHQNIHS